MEKKMDNKLLAELKSLYADGFPEDSEQDMEEYFSHIQEENAVIFRENGQIVSVGYFTFKPAFLFGRITHLPFLSAFSTRSEFRGKGKIGEIMREALKHLYELGESVCALYPFDHTYYLRHGCCNISFCTDKIVQGGKSFEKKDCSLSGLAKIEAQFASGFDNFLVYGEKEISDKLRAYSFGDATAHFISDAYYIKDSSEILHYASVKQSAIEFNEQLKGCSYSDFHGTDRPHTQGRIVNAQKALALARYFPDLSTETVLRISDPYLPQNNVTVKLKIENGKAFVTETVCAPDRILTIAELCALVFLGDGKLIPYQKNYFGDLW